jgi:hypothetical protein
MLVVAKLHCRQAARMQQLQSVEFVTLSLLEKPAHPLEIALPTAFLRPDNSDARDLSHSRLPLSVPSECSFSTGETLALVIKTFV